MSPLSISYRTSRKEHSSRETKFWVVLIISQFLLELESDPLCAPYVARVASVFQNKEANMRPIVVIFSSIRLKTKQDFHQLF
jgi:hypothetical protein